MNKKSLFLSINLKDCNSKGRCNLQYFVLRWSIILGSNNYLSELTWLTNLPKKEGSLVIVLEKDRAIQTRIDRELDEAIEQLRRENPELSRSAIFRMALRDWPPLKKILEQNKNSDTL